jgi:hypothetical protein
MIVSLEAIFLSTFVMVSQNRQAARDSVRANLDVENNVRAEVWSAHIGKSLGLDPESIEQRVQEILEQSKNEMSGTATGPLPGSRDLWIERRRSGHGARGERWTILLDARQPRRHCYTRPGWQAHSSHRRARLSQRGASRARPFW